MHHVCTVHSKQTIRLHYLHSVRLPWNNYGAHPRSRRLCRVRNRENKQEIGNPAVSNETLLSEFPKYVAGEHPLFDFLSYRGNVFFRETVNLLSEFGFRN